MKPSRRRPRTVQSRTPSHEENPVDPITLLVIVVLALGAIYLVRHL